MSTVPSSYLTDFSFQILPPRILPGPSSYHPPLLIVIQLKPVWWSVQVRAKGAALLEGWVCSSSRGIGTYRFQLLRIVKLKGCTEELALGWLGPRMIRAEVNGHRGGGRGRRKGAGLGAIGWKISPSRIAKQLGPQIPLRGSARSASTATVSEPSRFR